MTDLPRLPVAVDVVILTIRQQQLHVLLMQREIDPFSGQDVIPGGFVAEGEPLEAAALRVLRKKTGVIAPYLEQLQTFGDPDRDPRGHVITVAYYALLRPDSLGEIAGTTWFRVVELLESECLRPRFNHHRILKCAVERIRGKIDYAPCIATSMVPEAFTIGDLRTVYDIVKGQTSDRGNFRKRFLRMADDGLIVALHEQRYTGRKPAELYRFGP